MNYPTEIQQAAIEALRSLRKIQERIGKRYGDIRNSVIAHRDADALSQYRVIRDLRPEEVLEYAAGFYSGAERFISLLPSIMQETGSLKSLVRQYINKSQKNIQKVTANQM